MEMLPRVRIFDKVFIIDERLSELRNLGNPSDKIRIARVDGIFGAAGCRAIGLEERNAETGVLQGTVSDVVLSCKDGSVDAKTFFSERFPNNVKGGQIRRHAEEYYQEWLGRFESGHPEGQMDSESRGVFEKLKRESGMMMRGR